MSEKMREALEEAIYYLDNLDYSQECEDVIYKLRRALTQQPESELTTLFMEAKTRASNFYFSNHSCDTKGRRRVYAAGFEAGAEWQSAQPQPAPQVPEGFEIEKNGHGAIRVELLGGTERGHASAWLTPRENLEGRILYWLAHDLLALSSIEEPG